MASEPSLYISLSFSFFVSRLVKILAVSSLTIIRNSLIRIFHLALPLDIFGDSAWASGQNGEEIPIALEPDAGGMSFAGKASMVGIFATAVVAVFWRRMRRSSSDAKYS